MFPLSKVSRLFITLGVMAFLFGSFLSLFHFGMKMIDDTEVMSHCPFMSEMTICYMSLIEHIGSWQSIFSLIITPDIVQFLLLLLTVIALPFWSKFFSLKKLSLRQRFRPPSNQLGIPSIFQYLFSSGILNPKLF